MKKIKILYVEDEPMLAKIVSETLEVKNYEVVHEGDGANVMRKFWQEKPDICILDIMLPNKDGYTIAEEIRESNKDIPIIFLTAKTQTNDLVKGFNMGGNDYIRKPFSMEELIARIENALRKRDPEETLKEEHIIGNLRFNPIRQELLYGDVEKKLSFRESELLRLLIENKDKVIDRRDVLNILWGNDSFFNSRTLDVYITKLRGYLKVDEQLEIITIKGVGYKFVTA